MDAQAAGRARHGKDCDPTETVDRARGLLDEVGVELVTLQREALGEHCSSVMLAVDGLQHAQPRVASEGKGSSPALAMASGYAEFLERVQNAHRYAPWILRSSRFGLMPEQLGSPPDALERPLGPLQWELRDVLPGLLDDAGSDEKPPPDLPVPCLPYRDLFAGGSLPVPVDAISNTTGMCAGNTPAEALVQGLCEILERWAMQVCFVQRRPWPAIPHAAVRDPSNRLMIEHLEAQGLRVLLRDASLGGQLPVVAVVFFDPQGARFHTMLGSHPLFEVALRRCLNEEFQNSSLQRVRGRMHGLDWSEPWPGEPAAPISESTALPPERAEAFHNILRNGSASYGPHVLLSSGSSRHAEAFLAGPADNRTYLRNLLGLLRTHGVRPLLRDVSYLGLPAYHLFVPEWTLWRPLRVQADRLLRDVGPQGPPFPARTTMLSLPSLPAPELRTLTERLAARVTAEHPMTPSVHRWFGILVPEQAPMAASAHRDVLLAELFLRLGDHGQAARWLGHHVERAARSHRLEIDNPDYVACTLTCLKLRAGGHDPVAVQQALGALFAGELVSEVLDDLASAGRSFSTPLPICGDCARCPLRPECVYPRWKDLVGRLNDKMGSWDWAGAQQRLAELSG